MKTEQTSAAVPIAANDNDNEWDGRQVLAWPTAKRLAASKRHDDLALLVAYRRLVALAYGTPANDNYHNAAPAPGEDEDRSASEVIEEVDRLIIESSFKPTIEEMQAASPPWPTNDDAPPPCAEIVAYDHKTGNSRRELTGENGTLAFINGSELREYRTSPKGKWTRPHIETAHHRPKKNAAPAIVPSAFGQWTFESQIEARDELRFIYQSVPASTIMVLELACGSTRAQEIGEAFRKREKTAERFGVAVIDGALDNLRAAWNPQTALCA